MISQLRYHLPLAEHSLPLALLGEDATAHLEHTLEAFLSLHRVLLEACDEGVLDAVLYPLPATAQSCYSCRLLERGLASAHGPVDDGLLYSDEVRPCDVLRHHGNGLLGRVDVRHLEDLTGVCAADNGLEPVGYGLLASDETLGSKNASRLVDTSR